jgi:thiosulfate/3-mercaptopyruvate sulfurtransferase
MTRYVIVGAGAVGATVAAQLHLTGVDVALVARGANLAALRADGLRYVRPDGEHVLAIPAFDQVALRSDDILVLATKSQDSESALAHWAWQPVQTADGVRSAAEVLPVVILQNGLASGAYALRRFATVIDGVVLLPSSHLTPGVVVAPGAPTVGAFYLGQLPSGPSPVATAVAADFNAAHLATQVVTDIARWKAGKLLGNLAHNLDALYSAGPLRDIAARALVDEGRAVFETAGIDAANLQAESELDLSGLIGRPIAGYERGGSSTWQSLARSASVESDFLNGEIALLARQHGADAPLNIAIQRRIARVARDGLAPGSFDTADLESLLQSVGVTGPTRGARVLADVKDLHDKIVAGEPPVLLDVRWALGDPHGRDHYVEAHIPGAIFVDLETELAAPPTAAGGRHPLPALGDLQRNARRWGVDATRPVVIYDNSGGQAAARAWWLLRWAGVADVRLLNGGLRTWQEEGFDLEAGEVTARAGTITLTGGHLPVLTADDAAGLARDGVLLDARAGERYRGEVEPVDPKAGHIPGARSAPTAENLSAEGTFLTESHLRERFGALGADGSQPVGVYCGSGVTAAHQVAALAIAGVDAALYPGSWSAWLGDPTRPIATGPDPKGNLS